ncbi:MAG: Gfo/Idh/MocA family oxidoreductase [Solirubrobacterales bacterium]
MNGITAGLERPRTGARSRPLRVGVVGAGRIGALHAELLAHEVAGAELVAVYDPVDERAGELAARLAVERTADAGELIGDPGVDAIAVCSSTDTHAALIEAAADAGKPIFCEKPVSLDLRAVEHLNSLVDGAGLVLQVGSTAASTPRTHRSGRRWPTARWESRTCSGSPAAIRSRRPRTTSVSPAGSSST